MWKCPEDKTKNHRKNSGNDSILIRREQPEDYNNINFVVKEAFASAEHSDGNEQDLVDALRQGKAYIPELSLIAYKDDKIVGHILFTKMKIGSHEALALAPLSVLPDYQRSGIGSALIAEGHRRAKAMEYDYSAVLGSENYYPRFGFLPASSFGIEIPEGFPAENFMVCRLREDAPYICGAVKYADEFGI